MATAMVKPMTATTMTINTDSMIIMEGMAIQNSNTAMLTMMKRRSD